ncbi:DUF4959 domain-containing protein [Chitinophaga sp. sic0106]|uniref:DUF4959 domain-containing protein n=1 Tax=Chitinophaga sp. sic0106 TaxID=2854785 RepID=UPI001C44BABB|nr:DUF4959 domain-containing protein [Chitinophaga sp. sic0106]MBV7529715.1 DUF4959 domain-containing protein [Chitinophaga sp. sic0106]
MQKRFYLLLLSVIIAGLACKKEGVRIYADENAPAPAPITKYNVTNTPGGAIITYTVPDDPNLLYVKAVYNANEQIKREAKTSYFGDTLIVAGFGDTLPHIVKLYTVGRNEKASAPVEVTVNPLLPPVWTAKRSLDFRATFGGVVVIYQNPAEAPITYFIMQDTTGNGTWKTVNVYTSAAISGAVTARGFDTIPQKFAVYCKDRWGNKSDTLTATLKPIFETPIDKAPFKEVSLPSDNNIGHTWSGLSLRNMTFLWNNVWNTDNDCFHTKTSVALMPAWFTFDMGYKTALSRFKLYHRSGTSGAYVGGDPKVFEIYGSNNPNPDGSWDSSWELLGQFTSIKPTPGNTVSAEDRTFASVNGEDFDMPPGIPAVRFLRFKILQTWGGFTYFYISELSFWGARQ